MSKVKCKMRKGFDLAAFEKARKEANSKYVSKRRVPIIRKPVIGHWTAFSGKVNRTKDADTWRQLVIDSSFTSAVRESRVVAVDGNIVIPVSGYYLLYCRVAAPGLEVVLEPNAKKGLMKDADLANLNEGNTFYRAQMLKKGDKLSIYVKGRAVLDTTTFVEVNATLSWQ